LYHYTNVENSFEVYDEEFNGVANKAAAMAEMDLTYRFVSFQDPNNSIGSNIAVGDLLRYDSTGDLYYIRVVTPTSPASVDNVTQLEIAEYDTASVKWTFLFGDDDNQYTGTVHDELETISDDKCKFSIYNVASDTGIDADSIESGSVITVLDDDGKEYLFNYSTNENGKVVIQTPTATNIIKPTLVTTFSSDVDLFPDNDEGNWSEYTNRLLASVTINTPNDMNENTTPIDVVGDKYNYYNLTFDSADVKEGDELNIGVMIKGMIDGNMQWEQFNNTIEYAYFEGVDFTGGPALYPTTSSFGTSEKLAKTYNSDWTISAFNVVRHQKYGFIPYQRTEEIKLPNIVKNGGDVFRDYPSPFKALSFTAKSLAATNIPKYLRNPNTPYSTHGANYVMSKQSGNSASNYQTGFYESGDEILNDKFFVLVKVTGQTSGYPRRISLTTDGVIGSGVLTEDNQAIDYKLNGFCLYKNLDAKVAEVDLSYATSDAGGNNSYIDLLEELAGVDADITAVDASRDNWMAGVQVVGQEQRYSLITKLMKQGFCTGHTDRFGVDVYKTIPEEHIPVRSIDNDLTIADTIKGFSSSDNSKVYNEFFIKGGHVDIEVKNVTAEEFPESTEDYSDFVTGIDNYTIAKEYWLNARNAYLITQTIHKIPSDRSDLDFAGIDTTNTYAEEYTELLIDWTTYPKLQTKFSLPLTSETVTWGLMDSANFKDPIITDIDGGDGFITSMIVDPKKARVNCEMTFTPEFYVRKNIVVTDDIIEDIANTDNIIEDQNNTDNIIEI
jgi:hypothetical protein